MKSIKNATILVGVLSCLAGTGLSFAQFHSAPSSRSMIQSLQGGHVHGHSRYQAPIRRSVETSRHVAPRGCSSNHGNLSYQVDSSCQLCTTRIQFLKNSCQLADRLSYQYLVNLAYALNSPELRCQRFVIEGHASAEGSYHTNLSLSQRRANTIFDFLIRQGVCPTRLLSVGHGESQAQHSARCPEYLRAQDRRVIIFKMAG